MADKKGKLLAKEKSLWDEMMLEVVPIHKKNKRQSRFDNQLNQNKLNEIIDTEKHLKKEKNFLIQKDNNSENKTRFNPFKSIEIDGYPLVGAFSFIEFCTQNVSIKQFRQLKKGHFPIKASIDLHGFNTKQAQEIIEQYLAEYHQCCLLMIHGKGYHSKERKSELKSWLNSYLRKNTKVRAFCSAKPSNGGTGAVYVLIK